MGLIKYHLCLNGCPVFKYENIYVADIHGAFDRVKTLLSEKWRMSISLPVISLISLLQYEYSHQLPWASIIFSRLALRMQKKVWSLKILWMSCLIGPKILKRLKKKAQNISARQFALAGCFNKKYKFLENILAMKQKSQIFALPGNYDMDLKYTSLHERDLHLHWHDMRDLRVAGYAERTSGLRGFRTLRGALWRKRECWKRRNEMYNFFKAVKPDIIVIITAHGIHDR